MPLFPTEVDPELKRRLPTEPKTPPFDVRNATAPELVAATQPENTVSAPPVLFAGATDRPAAITIVLFVPLEPLPVIKDIEPPLPAVASPDPRQSFPELHVLAVPELNARQPLDHKKPPFAPIMVIDPLLEAPLSPAISVAFPPSRQTVRPD